jgi:hypothetical protein
MGVLIALTAMAGPSSHGQQIIYVSASASGRNTGMSWPDAFVDVQDALGVAEAGDEAWIVSLGPFGPMHDADSPLHASFPQVAFT